MRKGHSITGMKVIGNDGEDLGKVLDLIFDTEANECLGLVLQESNLFGLIKPQVVLWKEISTIGKDAVMVYGADSIIQPKDDVRIYAVMQGDTHLSGTQIYSEDGTNLGTFGDVYLDEATGRVVGYEVSGGFVADTMSGKRYIGVPQTRVIGDDVMIVPQQTALEVEQQAKNEPGGVKGVLSAAGEKVSGAYDAAKDKAAETYDAAKTQVEATYANIADASIEKQKEFVVGKVASQDVFLPAPTSSDAPALLAASTESAIEKVSDTPATPIASTETSIEKTSDSHGAPSHGELLVAQGDTITAEQANKAESAGILHALVLAAGSGVVAQSYDTAKDKVSAATSNVAGTVQEKTEGAQQSAEEAAIGKQAGTEVNLPNGSTLLAPGMVITREIMEAAKSQGKDKEVIASAGIGAASQNAQNAASVVQDKAGSLWDAIKEKTAELTGTAQEKKEEFDAAAEKRSIDNALGRPVTRVILAKDDSVILNTGELITHKAVDLARDNDVLEVLLSSVYDLEPEITPEMMRVKNPGEAALPTQQVPTGAPITATVSPDIQPQTEPAQGDPAQARPAV
ncbi:hypothetical protein EON83_12205 [bacterium]|nr:MAG: hypothetical protein EON83_12205 [bacterium]